MKTIDSETQEMLGSSAISREGGYGGYFDSESYDAGNLLSPEMMFWGPALRSADDENLPEIRRMTARVRDAFRNDAFVQGGATLQKDSIVGSNYMLTLQPDSKLLFGKEDTKWEDEFSEEVEGYFTIWGESDDNWVDASRINNFTAMIRLAVGIDVVAGETLMTAEWLRDWPGFREFSTAVQMVDIDRLSTPAEFSGERLVKGGVRKNEFGAPQGYYIRDAHPSDKTTLDAHSWTYSPIRKPWGRMQVLHAYSQNRAAQTRGIAQIVAGLKEMKMAKRFRDVVLQNAVTNASYAASIESELPTDQIFARLGGSPGNMNATAMQAALNSYIGGYFTQIQQYVGGSNRLAIDGVKIPHLPPGAKLQLRPAGHGNALGDNFEGSLMRNLAVALGTSAEELSRDFTKTNYSGFKGALAVSQRGSAARKKTVADRTANFIFRLFFEEAANANRFETLKRRKKINIYENSALAILTKAEWIGASSGQIDELKETQAAVLRINAGLSTISDECAKLGKDWRRLFRQLAREREWKEYYKVLQTEIDTQNMMNATSDASNKDGQETNKDQ